MVIIVVSLTCTAYQCVAFIVLLIKRTLQYNIKLKMLLLILKSLY